MTNSPATSPRFVHLKCHTEYSVVDGLVTISGLLDAAKADAMPAVAITDLNNIFALVKFYKKARPMGIKPIAGAEVVVRFENTSSRVTLLCMNNQGYLHLSELLTQAYTQGQEKTGTPEVSWAWLEEKNKGLIALSGGMTGDVGQLLLQQQHDEAMTAAKRWQAVFADRYYIELSRAGRENESNYLHAALKLAEMLSLPVVAVNDVRFLRTEDFRAHEAKVCIHSGYMLDDAKRPRDYTEDQRFKSQAEMASLFEDIPEALANTVMIAKRCNVTLSLGTPCLPQFPVPDGVSLDEFLRAEVETGLKRYWESRSELAHTFDDYQERIDVELGVIGRMGFPGYFLIVADFIRWAKENDIPVGPGRGSGAGSLVAFFLGITMLDPLEHELLFERFLNPERVSMPDFDVDFCMERRDEVIEYVARHYGQDAVSQIITYGTMAAKAVVRDVGRVLGYPYGFVDKLAKLIPFELGITLSKALQAEDELRERYESEEEVTILIDLALKLEGLTRNVGKHAGGVVIAPSKLSDFSPLYCEPSGEHPVTQFDKDDVEAVGLVKFDFLGLRTLTIIHWALTSINAKKQANNEAKLDIDAIPYDDEKTFKLMQACSTTAVFQLESRGMKELIKRLQPHSFDEITALVALFRPGPLQSGMVDDFIDRKHGRAPVEYDHPDLEAILDSTYGIILYQEQVMKIAQVLANYSLGGADILRRAMGKKKPEEMAKQRAVFRDGALENNIDEKLSMHIFDLIEKFAGYGFNKSHSAAYALIAYQTAYLKAHFPAEFMAAVLSSDMDNTDKVVGFLTECKSMGLTVLPPCINRSRYAFCVNDDGEIVYGLGAIKGVGQAACENIVDVREAGGKFTSLFNLCDRVDMRKLSRRGLEPLIRSGALDSLDENRATLTVSIDRALQFADQNQRNQDHGQNDLFALEATTVDEASQVDYQRIADWSNAVTLQYEKESLGFYLSGHPFDLYKSEVAHFNVTSIAELSRYVKNQAKIAGMLVAKRIVMTKRGKRMAILVLEDQSSTVEVTIFPRLLESVADSLELDRLLVIGGNVELDDYSGSPRVVAEKVLTLMELREAHAKRLILKLGVQSNAAVMVDQLQLLLKPYVGGSCPVVIHYSGKEAQCHLVLGQSWRVSPASELIQQLRHCCGDESVMLEYA